MSDCEETNLFWASLISPGKRKRKKDSKRDKKCKKKEQTGEKVEKKKKKNSKFKEAMGEKKRIKKQKKKKKNRSSLELDGEEKPQTSNPSKRSSDELKPDKKKRKKKVSFDLSPGVIWAKRPKSIPPSSQRPKESVLLEDDAAASAGEFTASGQAHDDDSQDINSQDLFITQKTFRASPCEPSSGEASDEVIPRTLSPQIERHLEGSLGRPREFPHFRQRHGKMNEYVNKTRTLLTQEEEERSNKVSHEHKKREFTDKEDKKVPCPPVRVEPRVGNPFLDDPFNVTPSLSVAESKTSTSTQTENLFTTELSSYLNFCRRVTVRSDVQKPLDLSLPQRARKDFGTSSKINRNPSGAEDVAVKREPSSRHRRSSLSGRGKSKASPTLQSESETKCAETTNSSEDNEPTNRFGKTELTQARAVQTKLNESFFFKTKGDGQSPRPESPLMKLDEEASRHMTRSQRRAASTPRRKECELNSEESSRRYPK